MYKIFFNFIIDIYVWNVKLKPCKGRHTNNKYYPIYTSLIWPSNLKAYISYQCTIFHRKLALNFLYLLFLFFKVRKEHLKGTALTKIYFLLLISLSHKLIMGNHKFHILDEDYRDKICQETKTRGRISKELGTSNCCFWLRGCYCSVKCFYKGLF